VCNVEAIGVQSIFKTIRSGSALARMLPTSDLSCEENTTLWKWNLFCASWTAESGRIVCLLLIDKTRAKDKTYT
jgi:hypothetical protein